MRCTIRKVSAQTTDVVYKPSWKGNGENAQFYWDSHVTFTSLPHQRHYTIYKGCLAEAGLGGWRKLLCLLGPSGLTPLRFTMEPRRRTESSGHRIGIALQGAGPYWLARDLGIYCSGFAVLGLPMPPLVRLQSQQGYLVDTLIPIDGNINPSRRLCFLRGCTAGTWNHGLWWYPSPLGVDPALIGEVNPALIGEVASAAEVGCKANRSLCMLNLSSSPPSLEQDFKQTTGTT